MADDIVTDNRRRTVRKLLDVDCRDIVISRIDIWVAVLGIDNAADMILSSDRRRDLLFDDIDISQVAVLILLLFTIAFCDSVSYLASGGRILIIVGDGERSRSASHCKYEVSRLAFADCSAASHSDGRDRVDNNIGCAGHVVMLPRVGRIIIAIIASLAILVIDADDLQLDGISRNLLTRRLVNRVRSSLTWCVAIGVRSLRDYELLINLAVGNNHGPRRLAAIGRREVNRSVNITAKADLIVAMDVARRTRTVFNNLSLSVECATTTIRIRLIYIDNAECAGSSPLDLEDVGTCGNSVDDVCAGVVIQIISIIVCRNSVLGVILSDNDLERLIRHIPVGDDELELNLIISACIEVRLSGDFAQGDVGLGLSQLNHVSQPAIIVDVEAIVSHVGVSLASVYDCDVIGSSMEVGIGLLRTLVLVVEAIRSCDSNLIILEE